VGRDRPQSPSRCPAELRRFDYRTEGRTAADIEAWGRRVQAWLDEDPARRHPLGGRLAILLERVRLKDEAWFIGSNGKTAAETIAYEKSLAPFLKNGGRAEKTTGRPVVSPADFV
jgi:hypothetical protein